MRNKYEVELNFKQRKTETDNGNFGFQSDQVVQSKSFIAFISSIVNFELIKELRPLLQDSKRSLTTIDLILGTMNKIDIRMEDGVWKPTKRLNDEQESILKTLKLDEKKFYKAISQIKL